MKTTVIEIQKLTQVYEKGKPNEFKALDGVDLKIHSGELVILYGPSGCGKSTLLNAIAGLEEFDSGKLLIRGEDISKKKEDELADHRRQKIGMVFQSFNLIKGMSILDNVAIPELFGGVGYQTRKNRAQTLLSKFGLGKLAYRKPAELSGGQQQKVALARALVNNPWIILADEPTGNLDSKSSIEVIAIIKELSKKSKRTILMVTHNPDHLKIADRVIYMKDGKIEKENKK
ncbi:MAG: putative ABC transport system ATP-binding protein [Candidatus Berkelbacteria bacterium Licking1014_85]|uniref:Putative ABC transport system ATP-binding protein n=1 Tax=Candidatus Berkelbacteria bacterium Licking1014_85 TaxID=2017148 RepID=A0A554LJS1_9BACT|nr:MAG: putative ABC transport system ATP-binding protein [Candidatus Berkelbacteria bacterium Licking1014_85]